MNWSSNSEEIAQILKIDHLEESKDGSGTNTSPSKYDSTRTIVIGADIIFFRDYHDSLIKFLAAELKNQGDAAFLVQPDRDLTLSRFISKVTQQEPSDSVEKGSVKLFVEACLPFCQGSPQAEQPSSQITEPGNGIKETLRANQVTTTLSEGKSLSASKFVTAAYKKTHEPTIAEQPAPVSLESTISPQKGHTWDPQKHELYLLKLKLPLTP